MCLYHVLDDAHDALCALYELKAKLFVAASKTRLAVNAAAEGVAKATGNAIPDPNYDERVHHQVIHKSGVHNCRLATPPNFWPNEVKKREYRAVNQDSTRNKHFLAASCATELL